MSWANAIWWFLNICLAVLLQNNLSGLDFLLPLFIVALQEKNGLQLAWTTPVFLLLQEGMGTSYFGNTLLWYAATVAFFYFGHWLFEVENFLFIFLLSACLGASHYMVFSFMSNLQDIPVNLQTLLDESVFQALLTPLWWRFAVYTRQFVHIPEAEA